ncbi:hypothetical protein ACF0H5_021735 [Mactra antiquata]
MDQRKAHVFQEQRVLFEELKSLPRGAHVYKQQQNSQIFFRANKDKVFEECKKTLDNLVEEYKQCETSQSNTGETSSTSQDLNY